VVGKLVYTQQTLRTNAFHSVITAVEP